MNVSEITKDNIVSNDVLHKRWDMCNCFMCLIYVIVHNANIFDCCNININHTMSFDVKALCSITK